MNETEKSLTAKDIVETFENLPRHNEPQEISAQPEAMPMPANMRLLIPNNTKHNRAGITKNRGHGQGKIRRRMAKQSRRVNRKG